MTSDKSPKKSRQPASKVTASAAAKAPNQTTDKAAAKAAGKATTAAAPRRPRKNGASAPVLFPIVGLGASAGGLEAFEQFFRTVSPQSGFAFVLVPHLDPGHASALTEILQRTTSMPVVEITDHTEVRPDHVYVIPPNRELAIYRGVLQLAAPALPHGQRMPIDAFLRSLADDQGERAVGIVLSGTGTDGTQGLRAILGAGGIALVQDPSTARYSGMPLSAVRAGYATHVLPVEEMPTVLQGESYFLRAGTVAAPQPEPALPSGGINRLLLLLRAATGHDFAQYKKSTIGRRVERRMAQHDISDIEVYARFVKETPAEIQALFKELLINVTSFFRDREAFEFLRQDVLPGLLAGKPDDYVFRVWVAGCATGEEAYSIAMLLREIMDETHRELRVQIYSTDLDEEAIAVARAGSYPPNVVADVTPERLRRFFIRDDAGYRVKKEIREMVVFAVQNVIKDPPFTRLDFLSCRNLMIYLEPELQARLIPAFHYALKPGGVLMLSPSESTGNHPELFAALSRKWKLFRATPSSTSIRAAMNGGPSWAAETVGKVNEDAVKTVKETSLAELTRRVLLQSYAPASVVADGKGNILFVHGETSRYLRPPPGAATLNVVDMANDGLQVELRTALHAAATTGMPTIGRELMIKSEGELRTVSLSVRPLADPEAGRGLVLVSFQDVARRPPPRSRSRGSTSAESRRAEELERDLTYTRENLQATIEEQQASNEELKSTNEELQSTNEELQSTNEELETSKEELQSVNEELVTVNAELQSKIEQLAGMQNDMKNLLDNISVGTVFLDDQLFIRRFTREAVRVYRLVPSDVGRSLGDIKSDLENEDLLADARNVLDTLVPCEREVRTNSGAWYLARLQPYRTFDNVIDGVVLTFSDISRRIGAETTLQATRLLASGLVDLARDPLLVLDAELRVVSANLGFYRLFRLDADGTIGRGVFELAGRQLDLPPLRELLSGVLERDEACDDVPFDTELPSVGRCRFDVSARRVQAPPGQAATILFAMRLHGAETK